MNLYDPNYSGSWVGYFKILKVYFTDDELKDYYGERIGSNPDYSINPETQYLQKETAKMIDDALNQLKEPFLTVYKLYYIEELTAEEIAKKVKMKLTKVEDLLAEAEEIMLLYLKKFK